MDRKACRSAWHRTPLRIRRWRLRQEDQVREEVRIKGELRYVRVTPRNGRPYFLIPDVNGATFIRRESLDSSLKVPMWVLFSF